MRLEDAPVGIPLQLRIQFPPWTWEPSRVVMLLKALRSMEGPYGLPSSCITQILPIDDDEYEDDEAEDDEAEYVVIHTEAETEDDAWVDYAKDVACWAVAGACAGLAAVFAWRAIR